MPNKNGVYLVDTHNIEKIYYAYFLADKFMCYYKLCPSWRCVICFKFGVIIHSISMWKQICHFCLPQLFRVYIFLYYMLCVKLFFEQRLFFCVWDSVPEQWTKLFQNTVFFHGRISIILIKKWLLFDCCALEWKFDGISFSLYIFYCSWYMNLFLGYYCVKSPTTSWNKIVFSNFRSTG